jgi:hypothetical protein
MTYAEMLAEMGATPEDIKLLDTPVARKAFEKQQAVATEAKRASDEIIRQNKEWATQVETQNQAYLKERDSAKIEAAKSAAAIAKMQELGLIEVAERLDPGSVVPKPGETPAFDPKLLANYVDRDTLLKVAESEGDAIAVAQDISFEHSQLFGNDPSKRLNFRELRREALSRKMPVESLWMEKYGVAAARAAAAAKAQSAHEAKIAADAVAKYKSENSTTNPHTAPPSVSTNAFTDRLPSAVAPADQPWLKSDAARGQSRTQKVLAGLAERGLVN